ncbi:nucleotide/sugar transporter family protein [Actinidia rufa]|uniref:Nucleotide/sugar transporter family protein n=1 Tax=Actinidia rufa TaxID=165716 RepID=A0A7J0FLW4_9ERIC|nr:nucleotide/sugar transporter family protein [Actinidia rufa]
MASERSFERLKLPERRTEEVVLLPKQSSAAMTKRGASAAISYMACAVLLIMFNKAAMSSYDFPCANVITLFQMTSSCLLLYAMRYWKIISFKDGEPEAKSITNNPATLVPLKTLGHTLPLALSYLLYMADNGCFYDGHGVSFGRTETFTFRCLQASSEKRIYNAFGFAYDNFLPLKFHVSNVFLVETSKGFISVAIIIFGALVAGARDLSFDSYSYAVVFISNICTAIYLASVARVGLLCGPILLFWTLAKGDLEVTMNFPHLFSPGFQVFPLPNEELYF